jgi:hypothetical protein
MAHHPAEVALRAVRTWVVKHVRPVSRQAIGQITGVGYAYRGSRGAGKRTPDAELKGGRLYEMLRAGKFVLITPEGTDFDGGGREDRLIVTCWTDGRGGFLLVRPDGYTAWAAEEPDESAIETATRQWTGPRTPR